MLMCLHAQIAEGGRTYSPLQAHSYKKFQNIILYIYIIYLQVKLKSLVELLFMNTNIYVFLNHSIVTKVFSGHFAFL